MFTRAFDRRIYITLAVLLAAGVIFTSFAVYVNWPSHRERGYMPSQPIEYSHKTHAGDLKIECLYCHTNAGKGPNATVPQVSTCMKCHTEVKPKEPNGEFKPSIVKVLAHWDDRQPIRWNKVHDLADFVYFDHSRHLEADLECKECHGPVETFVHMKRFYGQKMEWCLECHKEAEVKPDARGRQVKTTKAAISCSTCHR